MKAVRTKNWNVIPFLLPHIHADGGECECFGFAIYSIQAREQILFATDFARIDVKPDNFDALMIECNYSKNLVEAGEYQSGLVEDRRVFAHFALEDLVEYLKKHELTNVKEIHLLHPSGDVLNKRDALRRVKAATGIYTKFAGGEG